LAAEVYTGAKKVEVRGDGNRPPNQEFRDRYCSPYILRVIKWKQRAGRDLFTHWGKERFVQGLVGKPEGKRPLGRFRRR